ncbi:hypothetical protein [Pedobacter hiemivivus]|uniref:hypothetical protein n=1 Tax=Pedobacter hiemivivus TaxID=2530454 RepID=UPI0013F17108|nr:hypothetical protein [Pedobacter hiemivivus]
MYRQGNTEGNRRFRLPQYLPANGRPSLAESLNASGVYGAVMRPEMIFDIRG